MLLRVLLNCWKNLITASKEVAKVDFGADSIGNVVDQGEAAAADGNSVKGIAKGIKGIVEAAGNGEQNGAAADTAANPIAAAIGTDDAGAFNAEGMKRDDQIAAAIVLRGMAKGGKFGLNAANDANGKGGVKNAVESAVKKPEKLITANKEVEKVDFGGNDSIGNVVAQGNGGAADGNSVNGIAKGIKGIVEATGRKLDDVTAANTENGVDAGKLFGNNGAANAEAASKTATAVSGVSGERRY
ncbi:variable large family protein (plasmid) [Borreliella turdi]|uniref:variable large family protein n=1 Tax=Borreliella turdi TaxID=57863 RepID=UPI003AF0F4FD